MTAMLKQSMFCRPVPEFVNGMLKSRVSFFVSSCQLIELLGHFKPRFEALILNDILSPAKFLLLPLLCRNVRHGGYVRSQFACLWISVAYCLQLC